MLPSTWVAYQRPTTTIAADDDDVGITSVVWAALNALHAGCPSRQGASGGQSGHLNSV